MSTFTGRITEIPEISVDCFKKDNIESLVYFLSHCHTDHMIGLEDWDFQQCLVQRPLVYLYASPISVKILKHIYPKIEPKLVEITMYNSTLIKIPYKNSHLTVTALPAGHCPGSVMFLFETTDKNILYTGDYRVSISDLKKYTAFYCMGKVKKIDKMYLDTTFFNLSYLKLPPRGNSINTICSVIQEWIKQSPVHLINLTPSATYGSEYLYMEISKAIGMPIHVNSTTYNLYKCIPEMDKVTTLDVSKTQIHSNCGSQFKKICKKNVESVRKIVPSTLWWKDKDSFSMEIEKNGTFRICYSCHASLEEIEEFLLFLKPREVEPCVVSDDQTEKDEMFKLLDKVMSLYRKSEEDVETKLFQITGNEPKTPKRTENSVLDDLLESPTNNFKRKRLWLQKKEDQST